MKLLNLFEEFGMPDQPEVKYTKEDRQAFEQRVRRFNEYSSVIKQSGRIKEACEEIKQIVEMAGEFTVKETDGWFDNVTVNKHLKQLNDSYKIFEKTASEVFQLQQRLESAYGDIGHILERYYSIDDPMMDSPLTETKKRRLNK